ncbi:MAG: CRTAC1 family protein [Terracidiphilus sp.]|nr:CRTAC1 family protein [Terracidiphilus sp.]
MIFPRRRFLGSSLIVLGSALTDALTTPLWKWKNPLVVEASSAADAPGAAASPVQFIDVAQQAGLTIPNVWGGVNQKRVIIETKGSGLAFFDYDQDGWLDIYLSNGDRLNEHWPPGKTPTTHLYKNNRDGTFTDVTEKSGLGRSGWQTGVCVGDYDNDGWDDLFCTFWGHNILFRNNGNGTFTDVTRKAGLTQAKGRWGTGCTFLDYDRDGCLDLFVCNFIKLDPDKPLSTDDMNFCQWKGVPTMCGPRGLPGDTDILYHNNGDGTFTDVSEKAGILKPGPRYSITAVSYDFDNDGWPDIYVAVDSEPSMMFKNNHDGTFTDVAVMAGCAYNDDGHEQAGMGVGVADYDCDGWLDLFKTNFADDTSDLYHNNGDGTFSDLSFNSGVGINNNYVAWGCGFIDYDNDGWPDLMQVNGHVYPEIDNYNFGESFKNPRLVYRNLGNGRFKDVSSTMGPGITERFSSRGAAFGDYDNDGGMDALILNMNDVPSLLHNVGGNKQNWIKIKLLGTKCNRTAIGARVRVATGTHIQMDEVHSGTSVMSQSDLRLHFGLGKAETVDWIEVKWPTTQKIEQFKLVKANQILTIREGEGIVAIIKPKPA